MQLSRPIIFLFLAFCWIKSFAQEGLHIGAAILPQYTSITNLTDTDDSWKNYTMKATFGYAVVGKLGYNFGPPLGVHINVIWSKQGQLHQSTDPAGSRHTIQRDLTYLKIPLMLAISSDEGDGRRAKPVLFCFGGGLMYAMLLDAKIIDNGADKYPGVDVNQMFKPWHWGGAWYIGADIKIAGNYLFANARLQGDHSAGTIENRDFVLNGQQFYKDNRPKTSNFNLGITLGLTFVISPDGVASRKTKWWIR